MLFISNFIWPILIIWILFHRPLPFSKLYEDDRISIKIRELTLNRFSFNSTNYHPTFKSSTVYIHCSTSGSSSVRNHSSSCVSNLISAEGCPNEILKITDSQGFIRMKCESIRDSISEFVVLRPHCFMMIKEKLIPNIFEHCFNKKFYCRIKLQDSLFWEQLTSTCVNKSDSGKQDKLEISLLETPLKNYSDKMKYFRKNFYGSFKYSRMKISPSTSSKRTHVQCHKCKGGDPKVGAANCSIPETKKANIVKDLIVNDTFKDNTCLRAFGSDFFGSNLLVGFKTHTIFWKSFGRTHTSGELSGKSGCLDKYGIISAQPKISKKRFIHVRNLTVHLQSFSKQLFSEFTVKVCRYTNEKQALHNNFTNVEEVHLYEDLLSAYWTTCNPYSLSHNPSSSSGGEAVLQVCAGVPISFASDTGKSIRTLETFCGVFGHKPTQNIVSNHGADMQDKNYPVMESIQVLGPISCNAEDISSILQVLHGDKAHLPPLDADVFLTKCNFFYLSSHVGGNAVSPIEPEVRHAIHRIVDYLEDNFNVTVKLLHITELINILPTHTKEISRLSPNNSLCLDTVNRDNNVWVSVEILRSMTGFGRHTAPVLAQAAMERVGLISSFAWSIFGFKQLLNNQKLGFKVSSCKFRNDRKSSKGIHIQPQDDPETTKAVISAAKYSIKETKYDIKVKDITVIDILKVQYVIFKKSSKGLRIVIWTEMYQSIDSSSWPLQVRADLQKFYLYLCDLSVRKKNIVYIYQKGIDPLVWIIRSKKDISVTERRIPLDGINMPCCKNEKNCFSLGEEPLNIANYSIFRITNSTSYKNCHQTTNNLHCRMIVLVSSVESLELKNIDLP